MKNRIMVPSILIVSVVLALLCGTAFGASVDAAKIEARYGLEIQSDGPVVEFKEGDAMTALVTDPEKLSRTLGINGAQKGDMITMTYQGGNTFLFSGNSQGKSFGIRSFVGNIEL